MEYTERTRRRLIRDTVGWFTTVNPKGRPITLPVWFLWDGDSEILIYSLSNAARLRNIAANPNVSLHLDGDHHGGDIVVVEGTAFVDANHVPANENAAYVDRYRGYMHANGWTPEFFAGKYSATIRMRIDNARAW